MDISPTARDHHHLVVFNVTPYGLCAPAAEVEGIIAVPHIHPLPQAPPSIIGVVQHRGQMYRVISLRRKLGLERGAPLLEGQLILTHLDKSFTAFLVDEVVDVRPAHDFIRQPVSPHSRMDFFDAFLLRDEQILLHTTFARMEQARETPFLNPDLMNAADVTGLRTIGSEAAPETEPSEASVSLLPPVEHVTDPATDRAAETQSDAPIEQEAIPEEASPRRASPHQPPVRMRPPQRAMASSPSRQPRVRKTRPPIARRSFRNQRRTRRYALALTTFLVLLLFVVLSSTLWLKARIEPRQRPPVSDETKPSAISASDHLTTPSAPPETSARSASPMEQPSRPRAVEQRPAKSRAPSASTATTGNSLAAPTAVIPPSALQPEETINQPHEEFLPGSESSREILRLDTETFTLTVERPAAQAATSAPLPDRQQMLPGDEITHRVVSGDTLWDIAAHYLGDPFQYPELARLSQIRDPDLIYPGDLIRIRMKATAPVAGRHHDGP